MKTPTYIVSFIIGIILIATACNEQPDFVQYEPQFVVEGSIENGQYASILLSTSVSFTESMDTTSLLNHAIRNAKVTISNGSQSEILLLKTNRDKMPPYEYVTTEMRGEVGKNYYLTIEYYDKLITAETYIPEPVNIDSLWFVKKQENDTIGYIHIRFKNESDHDYQISTMEMPKDKVFSPCLYGNIDKSLYPHNQMISIQINKGPVIYPETSYVTYFSTKSPINVKLSTQTKESYRFWTSYQNELLNSQNPIFPSTNKLKSNIVGGIGIWAGYGTVTKMIDGSKK